MQKIGLYLILILIFSQGCVTPGRISISDNECRNPEIVLSETIKGNISEYGFYIQKGGITITESNKKTKLIFSMKYSRGENYLVSIKGASGFEGVRALITEDTLIVNDRINREVLYGEPEDFRRISGIPVKLLKICVGDIAGENFKIQESENENSKQISVGSFYSGIYLSSLIDCQKKKAIKTKLKTAQQNDILEIKYSGFRGSHLMIPLKIEIVDSKKNVKIKIEIKKFIVPWYGELEFFPGSNFKIRRI